MPKDFFVYIMSNRTHSVLYTGVTNNLAERVMQHKSGKVKSFTEKYKVNKLVYYEHTNYINSAIQREKQIKAGSRQKKIELIKSINKEWRDLSEDFLDV